MSLVRTTALALLFLGTVAAPARADWFATPYFGVVFGGAANQFATDDLDDEFEQRVNFGGSFGYRTKGVIGFEVDYNVAPNFFQFTGGTGNFDLFDLDSSVQTLMGNVVLAIPVGGSTRRRIPAVRDGGLRHDPHATAQRQRRLRRHHQQRQRLQRRRRRGLLRGTHFGLRADVRYFRGFESLDDEDPIEDNPFFDQPFATEVFNFWRGTLGVTFRW